MNFLETLSFLYAGIIFEVNGNAFVSIWEHLRAFRIVSTAQFE